MPVLEHCHDVADDVVALTFDDGPSKWTPQILDLLAGHGGNATFFVLGCLATDGADMLRRTLESGCEIGNHTFTHPHLPSLDDEEIRAELVQAGEAIQSATGTTLQLWRPPFFHVDERVRAAVEGFGLQEVGCSIEPLDWDPGVGRRSHRLVRARASSSGLDRVPARRSAARRGGRAEPADPRRDGEGSRDDPRDDDRARVALGHHLRIASCS